MARHHPSDHPAGFFQAVFDLFREAVGDIRKEVVERGFFGRVTEGISLGRGQDAAGPFNVEIKVGSIHNEFALVKVNEVGGPARHGSWDGLRKQLAQERAHHHAEPTHEHAPDKEHGIDR